MRTMKQNITVEKENGRVYTPLHIVENILDLSGYYGKNILKKHVIDNSCGNGAFLCEIIRRYKKAAIEQRMSSAELKQDLETYIHGVDIDSGEVDRCIENLRKETTSFSIHEICWDIQCKDSLTFHEYDGKMDYVLGNPPYVRVHNLGENSDNMKEYTFAQNGMTDLFLVFYEIGLRMLSPTGILGYITPSSFFSSLAGAEIRKHFTERNLLDSIVDLKHYQAFSATTYTAIVILKNRKKNNEISYYGYDEKNLIPYFVDTLSPEDYYIAGNFYFAKKEDLSSLKKVLLNTKKSDISVKNGYATLCDDVFIHHFDFRSSHIIPVIKSSKGIKQTIFYPYDQNGQLIPEQELKKDEPMYRYLLSNRTKLKQRSSEKDGELFWYSFGRSQAITDTYKDKLAINSLLRDDKDLKFTPAPSGTGVYGGLYIISQTIPIEKIRSILSNHDFAVYISLLGKYKSGGYYTYSSKDLKAYLDYRLTGEIIS